HDVARPALAADLSVELRDDDRGHRAFGGGHPAGRRAGAGRDGRLAAAGLGVERHGRLTSGVWGTGRRVARSAGYWRSVLHRLSAVAVLGSDPGAARSRRPALSHAPLRPNGTEGLRGSAIDVDILAGERHVNVVHVVRGGGAAVLHHRPAAAVVVALLPDAVGDAEVLLVVQDVLDHLVTGRRVDHEVQREAAGVVAGARSGSAATDLVDVELLLDVIADLGDWGQGAGQVGAARLCRRRGLLRSAHRRGRRALGRGRGPGRLALARTVARRLGPLGGRLRGLLRRGTGLLAGGGRVRRGVGFTGCLLGTWRGDRDCGGQAHRGNRAGDGAGDFQRAGWTGGTMSASHHSTNQYKRRGFGGIESFHSITARPRQGYE